MNKRYHLSIETAESWENALPKEASVKHRKGRQKKHLHFTNLSEDPGAIGFLHANYDVFRIGANLPSADISGKIVCL